MRGKVAIATKDLPKALLAVVREVGYRRPQITVVPTETVVPHQYPGDGERAFMTAVNLRTGRADTVYGSWGGGSPVGGSPLDRDNRAYPIPEDGAVIVGIEGGGHPVLATVYVRPDAVASLLPSTAVSERDRSILRAFSAYTAAYRREVLTTMGVTDKEIEALVARKLLRRTASGGMGLTIDGRNSLDEQEETQMKDLMQRIIDRHQEIIAKTQGHVLSESGSANPAQIEKIANAMVNAPVVTRLMERVAPSDEYSDLYAALPGLLVNALVVAFNQFGIRAVGGSAAERGLRAAARGRMDVEPTE